MEEGGRHTEQRAGRVNTRQQEGLCHLLSGPPVHPGTDRAASQSLICATCCVFLQILNPNDVKGLETHFLEKGRSCDQVQL